MERRLFKAIANPASIVTFLTGVAMLWYEPYLLKQPYMHIKLTLVLGMFVMHGLSGKFRKDLITDPQKVAHRTFRILNEIPTLLMIGIVIMIIVRPFAR